MAPRKTRTDVMHCICWHAKTLDVIIFGNGIDLAKRVGGELILLVILWVLVVHSFFTTAKSEKYIMQMFWSGCGNPYFNNLPKCGKWTDQRDTRDNEKNISSRQELTKMLSNCKSRWTNPSLWMYRKASKIFRAQPNIFFLTASFGNRAGASFGWDFTWSLREQLHSSRMIITVVPFRPCWRLVP